MGERFLFRTLFAAPTHARRPPNGRRAFDRNSLPQICLSTSFPCLHQTSLPSRFPTKYLNPSWVQLRPNTHGHLALFPHSKASSKESTSCLREPIRNDRDWNFKKNEAQEKVVARRKSPHSYW